MINKSGREYNGVAAMLEALRLCQTEACDWPVAFMAATERVRSGFCSQHLVM